MNHTPLTIPELDESIQLDKTAIETLVALLSSKTITEAAKRLNVTRQSLYNRMERYKLRPILETIPEQALDTLRMASNDAADVFVRNLNKPLREMEAAKEILDRVGVTGKKESMGVAFKDGDKEVKFVVTRG